MPGKKIYFEIFFDTSKLYFQNPNNDGPVVQHAMIDAEINST